MSGDAANREARRRNGKPQSIQLPIFHEHPRSLEFAEAHPNQEQAMPLTTLTESEHEALAELLSYLHDVCVGKEEPNVDWDDLRNRIQAMRLQLFEEE